MKFETENNTIFAIEQNVFYKGRTHDELMWAELIEVPGGIQIRWEDEFNNPIEVESLDIARHHLLIHKHKHTPYINGFSYD